MKKLTQYQKGWLSALIDGEGSISLLKERRNNFRAGFTYKARLSVGNTDLPLLAETQKIVGGGCITKANEKNREMKGHKAFWILDMSANVIRDIFPQIKLVVKDKQRQLLLKALKIISKHKGRSNPRTNKEIKQLEEIYKKIRGFNNKVWNKNE